MKPAVRMRRRLAIWLAAIAGGVDAIGYLTLFGLFTAHMTGNTVGMASALGEHDWHEALRRGFVIPTLVVGVIVGALLSRSLARRGVRASFVAAMGLEAALLLVYALVGDHVDLGASKEHVTLAYFALALLPALAMGIQSATLRRIADHSIRTTFVTGMLTVVGEQLVAWWLARADRKGGKIDDRAEKQALSRVFACGTIWIAYAVGGFVCAVATLRWRFHAALGPVVALAIAAGLDRIAAARSPDEANARPRPSRA